MRCDQRTRAIIALCTQIYPALRVNYRKRYTALSTEQENFCWIYPTRVYLKVGAHNKDRAMSLLAQTELPFTRCETVDFGFLP